MTARKIAVVALVAALLTQLHVVDVWISDAVFDFASNTWAIDHTSSIWRLYLYDGPKTLLILFALFLIGVIAFSPAKLARVLNRQEAIFLLICLAVVPGVTGLVKKNSGVSCPYTLERYNGSVIDSRGEARLSSFRDRESVVGCWPSGHASGGFALIALAFLHRPRRFRAMLAIAGIGSGCVMGAYQVLRGAHFASHILVTLAFALIAVGIIARLYSPRESRAPVPVGSPAGTLLRRASTSFGSTTV